ncbi:MAG: PhzF family phenazine biosynthesis protein [Gemmatimonadota bacterium]|nr:MAG: PhzF family phenazine biosynthesis protein [Gemmatimonadota bacterium]
MTFLPFCQYDAFTLTPLEGNACAIIYDADDLAEPVMQALALEMNLSETSFVMRSEVADFRFRFFTPAAEIPLAGHPTIATVASLVEAGRLKLEGDSTAIRVELAAGVVEVEVTCDDGGRPTIVMRQRKPEFLSSFDASDVMPAFGLVPDDALAGVPIMTVSTGTPQLMVPLHGHEALRRARMDIEHYGALKQAGDFFSPHLFCLEGFTEHGDTSARHFGLPPDTWEDPFTGSATGGMAAYLWKHGLIESPSFVAEQGHWMGRPGRASVTVDGPPDDIEAVRVGGKAVKVIDGTVFVP